MKKLLLIRLGSRGNEVLQWQLFLAGLQLYKGKLDGSFGQVTYESTRAFQQLQHLTADVVVGLKTYGAALLLGFDGVQDDRKTTVGTNWPPKPINLKALANEAQRQAKFGKIEYTKVSPAGDAVKITNAWERNNMELLVIPQLKPFNHTGKVYFHKKAAPQLIRLFEAWEKAGLLHCIKTFDGAFDPRCIRGRNELSCHAFGIAFDLNANWNGLNRVPALIGQEGSVRELVPIANEHGFFWGGHFANRLDGMHFEVAELK